MYVSVYIYILDENYIELIYREKTNFFISFYPL